MGDYEEALVGGGGAGARSGSSSKQFAFLKTKSIIDTLSELGPEVRHLTEEPPWPDQTNQMESTLLHPDSVDFQQYSDNLYDVITKRVNEGGCPPSNPSPKDRSRSKSPRHYRLNATLPQQQRRFNKIQKANNRGRTPEWIKKIFQIVKNGNLEAIVSLWEILPKSISHFGIFIATKYFRYGRNLNKELKRP